METKSIPELLTVDDEEFLAYTYAWRSPEKQPNWLGYFFLNDKVIPGYYFYQEHMMYLLSVPGVTTIKIRFGIRKNYLVLLMFGTDNAEERRTPYFIVDGLIPDTAEISSTDKEVVKTDSVYGNVPDVLAHHWIKNWSLVQPAESTKPDCIPIEDSFFKTHYGFLQGYNYSVNEIVDTLYKNKKNKSNSDFPVIQIKFALHKYIHFDPAAYDQSRKEKLTFGLIFHPTDSLNSLNESSTTLGFADSTTEGGTSNFSADKSIKINSGNESDSDAVYYDLSMPCPRTC